jgi:5-oxoprolinase (ATP-hydrolysing)
MVVGQFGGFIQGFLRSWKEPIKEGDVFITNDPYSCSAAISHLNDFLVINPGMLLVSAVSTLWYTQRP